MSIARNSIDSLRAIVDAIDVGIVLVDRQHNILLWNDFMRTASGRQESALLDRNLFAAFPELPERWLKQKLDSVFLLGTPAFSNWQQRAFVFRFAAVRCLSKHPRHMRQDSTLIPIRSEGGAVDAVCIVISDSTDASLAHERLAATTAALEEKVTELVAAQQNIDYLANHDTLTGLPNRRFLETHLKYVLALASRAQQMVAILSIDLDHFKEINDSFGHAAGDKVLEVAADRILRSVRRSDCVIRGAPNHAAPADGSNSAVHHAAPSDNSSQQSQIDECGDTVARLGGDEFLVVINNARVEEDAAIAARRIIASVCEPIALGENEARVAASVGISLFPKNGRTPEEILAQADVAMYRAKQQGRNGYQFYSEELGKVARRRAWLEQELKRAVEHGTLQLFYQPQVDVQRWCVIGTEALLRWFHPEDGPISPGEFIPIADDLGLAPDLGAWVLRTACTQAQRWLEEDLSMGTVSVNVSPRQMNTGDFAERVTQVLTDVGIMPSAVHLELTEAVLLRDIGRAADLVNRLNSMGVSMMLDDFGTGYSSLSYLIQLKLHGIKIDRSFVSHIDTDPQKAAIAEAIIALGKALHLEVIAEGVEREEETHFLQARGCHRVQGYLFAKPMRAEDIPDWRRAFLGPQRQPSRTANRT